MTLTQNQMAILKRIVMGTHSLEHCGSGFALWDRNITDSQGRTPSNAITESDINSMKDLGYLVDAGWGSLRIPYDKTIECRNFDDYIFVPANEGYTGPSFILR